MNDLAVHRTINADAETIFAAFIALYDTDRPSWVTDSRLDLREGGHWSVAFQVPNGPAFREDRTITALDRPHRLAYDMSAIYEDKSTLDTTVEVTIEPDETGHRITLTQKGFPTTKTRDDFATAWSDVLAELDHRITG